jgi:hypothetical protein
VRIFKCWRKSLLYRLKTVTVLFKRIRANRHILTLTKTSKIWWIGVWSS